MKTMIRLLGLKLPGSYTQRCLNQQNLKTGILMSLLTIVLSITMLLSMSQYQAGILSIRLQRFVNSCLLLASLTLLFIGVTNSNQRKMNHKIVCTVLYIYIIACLVFGISNSIIKYSMGDHLISYVAMTIWVFFLFVLRPIFMIGLSAVEFIVMYVLLEREGMGYYNTTEIFILWMILVAACIVHYQRNVHSFMSDHKIQEMRKRLEGREKDSD